MNLTVGSCENGILDSIMIPFFGGTGSRIFKGNSCENGIEIESLILFRLVTEHTEVTQ